MVGTKRTSRKLRKNRNVSFARTVAPTTRTKSPRLSRKVKFTFTIYQWILTKEVWFLLLRDQKQQEQLGIIVHNQGQQERNA